MTPDFQMKIGLEVLNHLGINLYSNTAAVLSEVVANAYDADATKVRISISDEEICIQDDGCGMTAEDVNRKFLYVGYDRRKNNEALSPKFRRPVMGRKGIGKLSLFSIADTIVVQTMIPGGETIGFLLSVPAIRQAISDSQGVYFADPLEKEAITLTEPGTLIKITDFRKNIDKTRSALKRRLARRFSAIEKGNNFAIIINDEEVGVEDRGYFNRLQYLWVYSQDASAYALYCNHSVLKNREQRPSKVSTGQEVYGWIGTVEQSGYLKDGSESLNKLSVFVRKKVAQEDILVEFAEGGLYTKYLIGEIHADFLDTDDDEDAATSSRQEIRKDDTRYIALREWLLGELKHIQNRWTELRNEAGAKEALRIPAIEAWFKQLPGPDQKKKAEALFGKINQLTIDYGQRLELFKQGVVAFEILRYKDNLSAIDSISAENLQAFAKAFAQLDDIEAALYYQIVTERLRVVNALQLHIDSNELEKVVQEHIFNHMWLLDPSWERATENPVMEQTFKKALENIDAKLTEEEKAARMDIKYKNAAAKHVIVELKRSQRSLSTDDIIQQVMKYSRAMRKIIRETNSQEPYEIIILIGKPLSDWDTAENRETSAKTLSAQSARIVQYQALIRDAFEQYKEFLEANRAKGRVTTLLNTIDEDIKKASAQMIE